VTDAPGTDDGNDPGSPPRPAGRRARFADRLEEGRQTYQPGLWSRLIAIGAIAVYALLFVVLNTRAVKVRFVFASARVSLIWVILLSLGVGVALGVLLSQLHRRRQRRG
jgi:uncharacterized integral membrane protein